MNLPSPARLLKILPYMKRAYVEDRRRDADEALGVLSSLTQARVDQDRARQSELLHQWRGGATR